MGQRKGAAMGHNKGVQRTRNARIASGKYTGCIIAAAFAPAVAMKLRSKAAFCPIFFGRTGGGNMAVSSEFCVDSQSGLPFSLASVVARAGDGKCRESPGEQRRGLFDSRASATVSFFVFRGDAEA